MARQSIVFVGCAILVLAVMSACSRRDSGVVKRDGEPDYVRAFVKARMDSAIAEARSSLDKLVAALTARKPDTEGFAVKKSYPCGDGQEEFIWINEVSVVGDVFEGVINNEPVDTKEVRLGQRVRVERGDVVDWMYLERGKLRGGYTIVALVYGTPDQQQYEKNLGIDWTDYRFLQSDE